MINEQFLAEIHETILSYGFIHAPNNFNKYCYYDKGWSTETGGAETSILVDENEEYFDIIYVGEEMGFMRVLCSLEGKDITLESINKEIRKL